jgi:hypothetical protein
VLVALCLAGVGLLAAPALAGAAPSPTELTARAQRSTITWGTQTVVTGTLMDTSTITALGGLWLRVEWSATGSPSSWTLFSNVTTETEAQYATGQYAQVVQPRRLTYYRFVFPGNSAYAAAVSNTVVVRVRPDLGRPVVPKAAKVGKRVKVWGWLRPQFPAGEKTVKVRAYRYKGRGRWVVAKRLRATNVDSGEYTRYKLATRFTKRGKYRFRAFTLTMDGWAPAKSRFSKTFSVR